MYQYIQPSLLIAFFWSASGNAAEYLLPRELLTLSWVSRDLITVIDGLPIWAHIIKTAGLKQPARKYTIFRQVVAIEADHICNHCYRKTEPHRSMAALSITIKIQNTICPCLPLQSFVLREPSRAVLPPRETNPKCVRLPRAEDTSHASAKREIRISGNGELIIHNTVSRQPIVTPASSRQTWTDQPAFWHFL